MKLECLDAQIVVTADAHNPTVLNPDFLSSNNIVPREWAWKTKDPIITTPAFSQVTYENDVWIAVEPPRMRVFQQTFDGDPAKSKIADIAGAYASVLRHVKYIAVGVNFRVYLRMDDPDQYLKTTFVKEGPWYGDRHTPITAALKLVYELPSSGRLLLDFNSGTLRRDGEKMETALIIASNFHRDCGASPADDVCEYVKHFPDDWKTNLDLVSEILSIEGMSQ
jgi:hypothetical protein